jgi:hypothetical protein
MSHFPERSFFLLFAKGKWSDKDAKTWEQYPKVGAEGLTINTATDLACSLEYKFLDNVYYGNVTELGFEIVPCRTPPLDCLDRQSVQMEEAQC